MAIDISDVLRRVVYAPNGVGPYQFTFEILTQTDIDVYKGSTLLTLTTDYTVSINGDGTGSVTLVATAGTSNITIVGARGIARTTDFVTGGDLLANSLNDELDAQTIFAQQTYELGLRALKAPVYDPTDINMTLPTKATRANKTLSFDADGNPTAGVSAADVANAVTYATNAANSATAAAASASAAASSASSASGSASTASTAATNASNSASAAATSETNAAASEAAAATSETNAASSASSASTSASNASTSASNASTSATNAANSASAAATSASNAATSETNAANSASAAAASAASAANTFDSFDDRYLGTKSSDPTLDNDGNALVAGALYFSTTENIMKVYDGASWIAATSAGNVSFLRYRYVATSGQTTFSGADFNAATLSYTVNNIVVFLNGVSLDQTEYTATSGTSVVLGTGAALNDELVIVAFKSFVTADMVPASTGGTYAGAVRFVAGSASVPSISVSGDTNTGIYFPAADTVAIGTGGTEALRIDSARNMGLGVTPSAWGSVALELPNGVGLGNFTGTLNLTQNAFSSAAGGSWKYKTTAAATLYQQQTGAHYWFNAPSGTAGNAITFTQAMTLDASGKLNLGVTSGNASFNIGGSGTVGIDFTNTGTSLTNAILGYYNTTYGALAVGDMCVYAPGGRNVVLMADNPVGVIKFSTGGNTERGRFTEAGAFVVAKTSAVLSIAGSYLQQDGFIGATRDGNACIGVNRLSNDGTLIFFQQAGTEEGSISVSGTTVSYNGGHLSRYAQTQAAKDESILKGTVLSNLDDMNVYVRPTTYWTESDELPEGVAVGDVKEESAVVANEQLNKVKVSDVEGDVNVAGVFVNWSYDEHHQVDEINMAMTGDMIIRIAQGVTVQKGNLLMSAGDGTAKPQGDDIVRSKTVAKVTSNHVTCTYEDGSYCVPCVLMAC